ncbi:transcriptional regulator PtsJ [Herbaspirillum seropedicae]|uniref:MocR-like B6 salvage transcription factor PtsJ n=1 Tax=Herbaspirillum seropedicae TaxID=964 RepID=UPI003D959FFA
MKIHGKTATEIFECVRTLVQTQRLHPGQLLPPVRELAEQLGVNRNTVAAAYRRLSTAGIASTQRRLGTSIRSLPAPGEQEGSQPGTTLLDLAHGNPDPRWLPDLAALWRGRSYQPRLYGADTVNPALANYITQWCGPDCPAGFEVDLAHGAVDAIERLLFAYLRPGDKVAVENPCFLASINLIRTSGLESVGVSVDAEGMRVDELRSALAKGVRAVILTPRAHNPTGCALSAARALALRRLLEKHPHVLVIVDDHFSLVSTARYHSVIPAAAPRWALVRSFSKALGPDLRVAAVASDAATSQLLRTRLSPGGSWVSHFLQDSIESALGRPDTARLMQQARADYAARRERLERALHKQGIACATGGDGLNLWIALSGDDQAAALSMARLGWLLRHGEAFSVQQRVHGLRITLTALEADAAGKLAADLRRSLS